MAGIKVDPPPVNMQIIDMKTGRPTRPFIEFMHRLWQRTGGEVDAIEDLDVTNSYPVFKPTSASDAEIGQPSFLEGQKGASEEQINEAIQNLSALVHAKAPQPDVLDAIESLRAVTLSDMAGLHSEIGELREHVENLITLVMIIERPGRAASDAVSNHVALPDPHSQYADLTGGADANFTAMPQVGGDPIVESGSNADGEWTRWSDGTQICKTESPLNQTATYGRFEMNYPTPFSNATSNFRVVAGSENQGSTFARRYNVNSVFVGSSRFIAYLGVSSIAYPVRYMIIGRWK